MNMALHNIKVAAAVSTARARASGASYTNITSKPIGSTVNRAMVPAKPLSILMIERST